MFTFGPFNCPALVRMKINLPTYQWHSQNAKKVTHHQRETTGSNSDSLQLRPFSKLEPRGSEFFSLRAVPNGMENHFYHIS